MGLFICFIFIFFTNRIILFFCRHMKIHDKDLSLSSPTSPSSSGKRKRPSAVISKKKLGHSDSGEKADEPPNKKVRRVPVLGRVIFLPCFNWSVFLN